MTLGAPPHAIALVKELQPYAAGDTRATHPIGIINQLDNADKHRKLIPTTSGVTEGISMVARRSQIVHSFYWPFCGDGAEVAKFKWDPGPEPPEAEVHVHVHVHVHGTPRVAVEVADVKKYVELTQALRWGLDGLPAVITELEKYV